MIPSDDEALRLAELAERVRDVLRDWTDVARGDALCACLLVVGSEAGYERAHDRERFLAYIAAFMGWAFDLGAELRKTEQS